MNAFTYGRPALTMGQVNGMQYPQGQPALVDPAQPNPKPPALSGNARGSSKIPSGQIDMRSEGLMRIGAAGLQSASDPSGSGGNWMAAMGQEYGNIQDYNRQSEKEAFALEESRRVEGQRRADAQAAAKAKANKPKSGSDLILAQEGVNELGTLIAALEQGGLTGPIDGTVQAWLDRSGLRDYFAGNDEGAKRAYYRQRLENYRVNEALAVTANTKGAISDKEMALFLAPIPATADTTEATWLFHLREKLRINSKILAFEQGAASGGFSFVD